MTMNAFGVVGIYSGGVIEMASLNWIPLGANHWKTYLIMLVIGLIAVAVWYFVFSFLIKKFDFKTPGRTTDKDSAKLYSKQDYRDKNKTTDKTTIESDGKEVVSDKKKDVKSGGKFETVADEILIGLGGPDNIKDFTNCVTRLRVNVKDPSIVESDEYFKNIGTYGTAKSGNSVHVIVGMDIQYVADAFGEILKENE